MTVCTRALGDHALLCISANFSPYPRLRRVGRLGPSLSRLCTSMTLLDLPNGIRGPVPRQRPLPSLCLGLCREPDPCQPLGVWFRASGGRPFPLLGETQRLLPSRPAPCACFPAAASRITRLFIQGVGLPGGLPTPPRTPPLRPRPRRGLCFPRGAVARGGHTGARLGGRGPGSSPGPPLPPLPRRVVTAHSEPPPRTPPGSPSRRVPLPGARLAPGSRPDSGAAPGAPGLRERAASTPATPGAAALPSLPRGVLFFSWGRCLPSRIRRLRRNTSLTHTGYL